VITPSENMTPRRSLLALGARLVALLAPAAARADIDPNAFEVAGNGTSGFAGDGGPAGQALLSSPRDTASLPGGVVLIADRDNNAIRRVGADGTITTVAGRGSCSPAPCGDGGPATDAGLAAPTGVAALPDGGYLIADASDHRVRRVSPAGVISTVAGTTQGFAGDGGPAVNARLNGPRAVAPLPDGGFLVADSDNNRIRRVLGDGRIVTVAGTGAPGFAGDGGAAVGAQLSRPFDVSPTGDGGFLVADTGNNRIRRVSSAGRIETLAGSRAAAGFAGDGGPALRAVLDQPFGVQALASGGFLVADTANNRVRRVSAGGTISTEAGTGGTGGAIGPGSRTQLNQPTTATLRPNGQVLIADTNDQRIRGLSSTGEPPPPSLRASLVLDPIDGQTRFRPRGSSAFQALRVDENVPTGSAIDSSKSEVQVSVQSSAAGGIDRVQLSQGPFVARQLTGDRPVTELELKDPPPRCASSRARSGARSSAVGGHAAPVARAASGKRRRLFARGKGRFRTRGRYGSGTKRGTVFLTEDRCDGTLFKVSEGRIAVRDFVTGKTIIVKAGGRYFARAGKRRK
jgi:hypothetical protein